MNDLGVTYKSWQFSRSNFMDPYFSRDGKMGFFLQAGKLNQWYYLSADIG